VTTRFKTLVIAFTITHTSTLGTCCYKIIVFCHP
jgi:hypothetical protein